MVLAVVAGGGSIWQNPYRCTMHIYTYMCIYLYTYVYIVYMYKCVCIYIYIYIYIYMYMCICISIHIFIQNSRKLWCTLTQRMRYVVVMGWNLMGCGGVRYCVVVMGWHVVLGSDGLACGCCGCDVCGRIHIAAQCICIHIYVNIYIYIYMYIYSYIHVCIYICI